MVVPVAITLPGEVSNVNVDAASIAPAETANVDGVTAMNGTQDNQDTSEQNNKSEQQEEEVRDFLTQMRKVQFFFFRQVET